MSDESKSTPPSTVWVFHHVTELGDKALYEASRLSGNTWTETINKALQLELQVHDAYHHKGNFGIKTPGVCRKYENGDRVVRSVKVNLSPRSAAGLMKCASVNRSGMDTPSIVLNRALQRWRDVLVAQTKGEQVFLQTAARMPHVPMRYA